MIQLAFLWRRVSMVYPAALFVAGSCQWYYTMAACTTALRNLSALCTPCGGPTAVNIGCPAWAPAPVVVEPSNVTGVVQLGTATTLIAGTSKRLQLPTPAVLPVYRSTLSQGFLSCYYRVLRISF